MLDCALKFVRAFDRLEEEKGHYKLYFCEADGNGIKPIDPPNYFDWEHVKIVRRINGLYFMR